MWKMGKTQEPNQEASAKEPGCQANLVSLWSPPHVQGFLVLTTDITLSQVFCLRNSNSKSSMAKGKEMPLVKCQNDLSSGITFSTCDKCQAPARLSFCHCMQQAHPQQMWPSMDRSHVKLQSTCYDLSNGGRWMGGETRHPKEQAGGRHGTTVIEPLASCCESVISDCKREGGWKVTKGWQAASFDSCFK